MNRLAEDPFKPGPLSAGRCEVDVVVSCSRRQQATSLLYPSKLPGRHQDTVLKQARRSVVCGSFVVGTLAIYIAVQTGALAVSRSKGQMGDVRSRSQPLAERPIIERQIVERQTIEQQTTEPQTLPTVPTPNPGNFRPSRFRTSSRLGDCMDRAMAIVLPATGRLGNWYFFERPDGISKKQMRQAGLRYDPVAKQWLALGRTSIRLQTRTPKQAAAICRSPENQEQTDCINRATSITLPAIGRLGNWYFFERPEGASKRQMRQAGLQYDPVAKQWLALGRTSVRLMLRTPQQAAVLCR